MTVKVNLAMHLIREQGASIWQVNRSRANGSSVCGFPVATSLLTLGKP